MINRGGNEGRATTKGDEGGAGALVGRDAAAYQLCAMGGGETTGAAEMSFENVAAHKTPNFGGLLTQRIEMVCV